jgi:hypothetical protein
LLFNKITALGGVVALCLLVGCSVTGDVPTDACEEGPSAPGTTNAPTGDLRGWKQVFVDNFDRCELGEMWGAYSGKPGGDPHSWWEPEQVSVTEGVLRLRAQQDGDQWVTGGVSNSAVSQTYGKWMVRLRAGVSDEISYHVLLWPRDEVWPPEIDIAESVSGRRESMSSFIHWSDEGEHHFAQADTTGRFDEWHTVGVEWGPGIVRYLVDDREWAEFESSFVPSTSMWLGIQAQAGACDKQREWGTGDCPVSGSPAIADIDIDWVSVYSPDFAALAAVESARSTDLELIELTPRR